MKPVTELSTVYSGILLECKQKEVSQSDALLLDVVIIVFYESTDWLKLIHLTKQHRFAYMFP